MQNLTCNAYNNSSLENMFAADLGSLRPRLASPASWTLEGSNPSEELSLLPSETAAMFYIQTATLAAVSSTNYIIFDLLAARRPLYIYSQLRNSPHWPQLNSKSRALGNNRAPLPGSKKASCTAGPFTIRYAGKWGSETSRCRSEILLAPPQTLFRVPWGKNSYDPKHAVDKYEMVLS